MIPCSYNGEMVIPLRAFDASSGFSGDGYVFLDDVPDAKTREDWRAWVIGFPNLPELNDAQAEALGLVKAAEKHLPGKHNQKLHGRPGGGTPLASAREESGVLVVKGNIYSPIASYGNINGAKARVGKEGAQAQVVRYNGRYWVVTAQTEGPKVKPVPGESPFNRAASSSNVGKVSHLGGGVADAELVEYKDDGKGVWKELSKGYHDGHSEVAAYRLSEVLGLGVVPETVYADVGGKKGTSQLFIEDATVGAKLNISRYDIPRAEREKVAALDYIIGNRDRHDGNYLRDSAGKLWAVDHGHSTWKRGSSAVGSSYLVGEKDLKNGRFHFSQELVDSLAKVRKEDFFAALSDVGETKNVNKQNAWGNLQDIVKDGSVEA